MTFIEMLKKRWQGVNSMVCVGLDSDYSQIGEGFSKGRSVWQAMFEFNSAIIGETHDWVCAYKPNTAFYEYRGEHGWGALRDTINRIQVVAPDVPIILDAKRTDIGNTNKGYAEMAFDLLGADAITVNPYFGGEALGPFLERKDKGVIVLCKTSNPGAGEIQDLLIPIEALSLGAKVYFKTIAEQVDPLSYSSIAVRLYEYIAYRAANEWNKNSNVLLVVGATYPDELKKVRRIVGDMPILVPGIGAQKGDLEATVKAGLDSQGFGMIINSARGIIFASKGEDFAEAAGREAKKLRDQINDIKANIGK
jgi:orotidine-5'-phosphate decarboxylase